MKKLLLLLLVAITMVSCSNSNEAEMLGNKGQSVTLSNTSLSDSDVVALNELQSSIESYNFSNGFTKVATRSSEKQHHKRGGFWRRFWQGIATAFADAVGGAIGGLPGATVTSGIVGAYTIGGDVDFSFQVTVNNMPARVVNIQNTDSIGFYHNAVLKRIFSDSATLNEFCLLNDDEKANYIINQLEQNNNFNISSNEEVESKSQAEITAAAIINAINQASSYDEFCNILNSTYQSNQSELALLKVLEEYMRGLSATDSQEEIDKYVDDMQYLVKESTLNQDLKSSLETSISVGKASDELWNKEIHRKE